MRQTTCAIAVVLGLVLFVTVPQLPPRAQSPPVTFPSCNVDPQGHYGARPSRSVYVPMRDGVYGSRWKLSYQMEYRRVHGSRQS